MIKRSSFTNLHAIVPVNIPNGSKTRLSRRLDTSQRASLTITMLINVLTALKKSSLVDSVTVVCSDRRIQALVERYGATFLWEGRRRGLNPAISFAMKRVSFDSSVLIIHADLPLLTSDDVDQLVKRSRNSSLAFVPSKDDAGTNAILMQSPNMINLEFGKDSFRKHCELARKKRLEFRIVRIHGVAFDVDDEQDLDELVWNHIDWQTLLMNGTPNRETDGMPILVKSR